MKKFTVLILCICLLSVAFRLATAKPFIEPDEFEEPDTPDPTRRPGSPPHRENENDGADGDGPCDGECGPDPWGERSSTNETKYRGKLIYYTILDT